MSFGIFDIKSSCEIKHYTSSYWFEKLKKQNFEISKSHEISLLKWTIQFRIIWKKCRHVRFCNCRYISCSEKVRIVYDHEITQHMHCVMLLCYFEKKLLLACVVVSKYVVFIWILGLQWVMQVHRYKYLQGYKTTI